MSSEPSQEKKVIAPSGEMLSFDLVLATAYGLEESLLIRHFQFWIRFNKNKKQNFRDGKTWTYQTIQDIAEHFPFMNYEKVKYCIELLVEKEVIIKGNYNKSAIDKTTWYAFVDENIFVPELHNESKNVYERENSLSTGKIPSGRGKFPNIPDTNNTDTKHQKQDKQQQEASPPAACAAAAVPLQKKVYDCLVDVPIKEPEKTRLTKAFPEDVVKNAIAFTYDADKKKKIKTSFIQTLNWACDNKPEVPRDISDKIQQNKQYAQDKTCLSSAYARIDVLNNQVEIVFSAQKEPWSLKYTENAFEEQLDNALRKYEFN